MSRKPKRQQTDDGQIVHFKLCLSATEGDTELQAELRKLAKEIVSALSDLEPDQSEDLLSSFVSDLFRSVFEQERRAERSRKQSEVVAAAKANGVRFGPKPGTMPDGFEELRQAWRSKKIPLSVAAELCGVPRSTFYDAALRAEMGANRTGTE